MVNVVTVTLHQNSSVTDLYNIRRNECPQIMVRGLANNFKTLNSLGDKALEYRNKQCINYLWHIHPPIHQSINPQTQICYTLACLCTRTIRKDKCITPCTHTIHKHTFVTLYTYYTNTDLLHYVLTQTHI